MTDPLSLLQTDVPGLDVVLGGGLTPGALGVIVGAPGAGKTVLVSQVAFAAARRGASVLLLTLYSEGHVKLLEHLRAFAFFEEALVGQALTILALQSLIGEDPSTLATAIGRTVRETGIQLVIIDGFQGIDTLLGQPGRARQLLSGLAGQLAYLGATLLVTVTGDARGEQLGPELTTADMVINLVYTLEKGRHTRWLDVVKQRGRAPLPGQHLYLLGTQGVTVLPRLEVRPQVPHSVRQSGRAAFNLPELDRLLGGGLTEVTTTVLAGALGAGKTTLALYWALAEARPATPTVWLTFGENQTQLQTKAAAFGLTLDAALATGAVEVIRLSPVELWPDVVAQQLLERLARSAVQRLVIDNVDILLEALGPRAPTFCRALVEQFHAAGVTSLFLLDSAPFTGFRINPAQMPLAALSDNLLLLQHCEVGGTFHRVLAILRMRYSAYDQTLRELALDPKGIRMLRPEETSPGLLEAVARGNGGVAPASP